MKHKAYSSKVRKNGQFDTGNSNRTIWYNSKLTVMPKLPKPFEGLEAEFFSKATKGCKPWNKEWNK